MLGSHPISAILGADIAATSDTASLRAYVKALADVGLYVLLCEQGTKIPADYRTPKQKEEDLNKFREEVGAPEGVDIGQPRGGIYLATNDAARLRTYVAKFRKDKLAEKESVRIAELKELDKKAKTTPLSSEEAAHAASLKAYLEASDTAPLNLAVEVGNSHLIVADCDTAAQKSAFCRWWASKSGDPSVAFALPTVLSPGVCENGVWKHKDGGHYYFTLDGFILPKNAGKMTVEFEGESFDVFWRDRYVLIPPSVRAEGPYRRVGPVLSLTENRWLEQEITRYCAAKSVRPRAGEGMSEESLSALVEWYNNTSWADILVPHGWEWTGVDKSCGCPIWGRPGGRSSDKSATAHEPGCGRDEYNTDDPPIHFWTSMPGKEITDKLTSIGAGANTLSKLQLFAALEHRGEDGDALRSIPGVRRMGTRSVPVPGMPFNTSKRVELGGGEDDGDDGTGDNGESYGLAAPNPPTPAQTVLTPLQMGGTTPVTEGVTPHVHPSYVQVPSSTGDVSSKSLVPPATIMPSPNVGADGQFVTTNVTPTVTPSVTPSVTGVPTVGVTENEAPRYDTHYGNAPQQHVTGVPPNTYPAQGHQFSPTPPSSSRGVGGGFDLVPDFNFTGANALNTPSVSDYPAPAPAAERTVPAYSPQEVGTPAQNVAATPAASFVPPLPTTVQTPVSVTPSVATIVPPYPTTAVAPVTAAATAEASQSDDPKGNAVTALSAEDRQSIVTDVSLAVIDILKREGVIK